MSKIVSTQSDIRLDLFLVNNTEFISRSIASKACKNGLVLVNTKAQIKSYKVQAGDVIEYTIAESNVKTNVNVDLDIKYEDDDIIVLSKPAGLICHSAPGQNSYTLVDALISHCGEDNLYCSEDGKNRLGIIHRLDKNTSGLMICAKSQLAGINLSKDMRNHTTSRHYKSLVHGVVKPNTAKIDAPLIRVVKSRPKMMVRDNYKAKDAITTFKVLTRYKNYSLLDCKIHTGRTHQIRAHMEFINHPVVGDDLYGGRTDLINRQFLHSYKITFSHPRTNKKMHFEDDLANDLSKVLKSIE